MTSSDSGISAFPDGDNIFSWVGTIEGAKGTVYENMKYSLTLSFANEYPYRSRTSTRLKRRWWNFPPRVSIRTSISSGTFAWIFWKSSGRRRITWGRFCCPFRVCWESRITIRRWIRTRRGCGRIKRSIESCCRRSIRRTGQRIRERTRERTRILTGKGVKSKEFSSAFRS